jgi:hypothetical protein
MIVGNMSSVVGIVKFRFKHQNVFDKIEFPSSEITVAELRIKIQEKLLMTEGNQHYKNATILQISKLGTEEPYEWDHELIPSQTSVIVSRVPVAATKNKQQRIVVDKTGLFAAQAEPGSEQDYFALKPSIIQSELDAVRRVPSIVVCELCSSLMLRESGKHPVILQCCGSTACFGCVSQAGETCPIEKRDLGKKVQFVTNRAVERLVTVIGNHKTDFVFDSVSVPENFLQAVQPGPEDTTANELEIVDVDDFEPEVFDVDNPRPLTAKEIEALERKERRKRKAMEILAKREGKTAVKGELTEADVNRLLKMELKAELAEGILGGLSGSGEETDDPFANAKPIVIEFPKLLTPEQFIKWQNQL